MAAPQRRWAAELLHLWFHELGPGDWFAPDPGLDALLHRRFARELSGLRMRPASEFLSDPRAALAAVLLFDQLPRNLHRGTPQAFATDPLARAIATGLLDGVTSTRSGDGIQVVTPAGAPPADVMVVNSRVTHNSVRGITADGSAARMRVATTSITANNTGVQAVNSANINTYGNNRNDGNVADGAFTLPIIPQE